MTGSRPPDFDPDLWVVADGYDGRGYLIGNSHAFPGRMEVWIESLNAEVSKNDDPGWDRWRAALVDFRETGKMLQLKLVPTISFSVDAKFDHVPWTWAGGQVWTWQDDAWAVAEPQPTLDGGLLARSACASRGYHEMNGADEHHVWCLECGETDELFV